MKKKIVTLGIVALLMVTVAGCGCKKKTDGYDINAKSVSNTSANVVKDQVVDGVKFSNVMMSIKSGQTSFTCDAENQGKDTVSAKYLVIHANDADGKELSKLIVAFGELKSGETKQISVANDTDMTKAKSVTYEFVDDVE